MQSVRVLDGGLMVYQMGKSITFCSENEATVPCEDEGRTNGGGLRISA